MILRWGIGLLGATIAHFEPMFPMLGVCFAVMLVDSFTAWRLARRVRERYPKANDGKFKSKHFGKVVYRIFFIMMYVLLAHLIQQHILTANVYFPNMIAGAFCFWEMWSILENESSCNEANWAKFLQKFLVSKASRHFDYDFQKNLEELAKDASQRGRENSRFPSSTSKGKDEGGKEGIS